MPLAHGCVAREFCHLVDDAEKTGHEVTHLRSRPSSFEMAALDVGCSAANIVRSSLVAPLDLVLGSSLA